MRLFLLTLGSRGDFEQMLALGRGLVDSGHQVVLGAAPWFAERTRDVPAVRFHPCGAGNPQRFEAVLGQAAERTNLRERTRYVLRHWVGPQLQSAKADLGAAALSADYFVSPLRLRIERNGHPLPAAAVLYDAPFESGGGDPGFSPYRRDRDDAIELVAMPRRLLDPEENWDEAFAFTGFWQPAPSSMRLDQRVERFLEEGQPPIVCTLGSMQLMDVGTMRRALLDALGRAGRRGIWIHAGAADGSAACARSAVADGAALPPLLECVEAPFEALFPRCSVVVHHGSTGTTAAALRAGRPSVVLPQIESQCWMAQRLVDASLASAWLLTPPVDPQALAAAILRADDLGHLESLRAMQQTMQADEGVDGAVRHIEAHRAERPESAR